MMLMVVLTQVPLASAFRVVFYLHIDWSIDWLIGYLVVWLVGWLFMSVWRSEDSFWELVLSMRWILQLELKLSGLVSSAFTCWVILCTCWFSTECKIHCHWYQIKKNSSFLVKTRNTFILLIFNLCSLLIFLIPVVSVPSQDLRMFEFIWDFLAFSNYKNSSLTLYFVYFDIVMQKFHMFKFVLNIYKENNLICLLSLRR